MSWLKRQSFLGPNSEALLRNATVGIVGLGGGGSHIGQQLAHAGIGNCVVVDPDTIEDHNLNRLIGGKFMFLKRGKAKVVIARDLILGIQPTARVQMERSLWQVAAESLRRCDVIVGGLDSFRARDELERFCRQNLIPYIDMGMDVTKVGDGFLVAGQVLLSSPGGPCLRCVGVVTDERLSEEAAQYGAAGGKPQVVWPNGVLASIAVGLLMQLIAPWHRKAVASVYREFDGNTHIVRESPKWKSLEGRSCPHHPVNERGDPTFDIRRWLEMPVISPKKPPFWRAMLEHFSAWWAQR